MFGRRTPSKTAETAILREELSAQRKATQGLVERYEVQVRNVRTAVKAVGKAREERDEYRRVLAASIATDSRREARVEALEEERVRLEALAFAEGQTASEEGGRRRELSQRVERLESRLTQELAARERVLGDAADRAWSEREASRAEVVRMIASHRGEVMEALRATRSELQALQRLPSAPSEPSIHPLRRVRTGALVGLSLACTLSAVALIPATVLAVGDPERALFVHLASGLGPWHLVVAVVLFCAAAVGLLSWALRDIEQQRRSMEAPQKEPSPEDAAEGSDAVLAQDSSAGPANAEPQLRDVEITPTAGSGTRTTQDSASGSHAGASGGPFRGTSGASMQ